MTKLLNGRSVDEVIDIIDESGESDERKQASVGVGFILGNYTDVEMSLRKRQRDDKYIVEVKQEIDIVGLFGSVIELIRNRKK